MTDRAGRWVTEQVGRWGRTVNEVAVELGCDWHTINDTALAYGTALIDDAMLAPSRRRRSNKPRPLCHYYVMGAMRLCLHSPDGRMLRVAQVVGLDEAAPSCAASDVPPELPVTEPSFDRDAAERLALFAYNVARKFFPSRPELVEEAVQETLTRTCERWEKASRGGRLEAWVVNTATYVCHEKLREESRGARFSAERQKPPNHDEELVRCKLLADSLRRLSRRQRLVVVWRYLFDFSVKETAVALGLTESKVRDASHNGVERLRTILGDGWSESA